VIDRISSFAHRNAGLGETHPFHYPLCRGSAHLPVRRVARDALAARSCFVPTPQLSDALRTIARG